MRLPWVVCLSCALPLAFAPISDPAAFTGTVTRLHAECGRDFIGDRFDQLKDLVKQLRFDDVENDPGCDVERLRVFIKGERALLEMSEDGLIGVLEPGDVVVMANRRQEIYTRLSADIMSNMFPGAGGPGGPPGMPPGGINQMMRDAMGGGKPAETKYTELKAPGCDPLMQVEHGDFNWDNWRPGLEAVFLHACLTSRQDLKDVVTSFTERFEKIFAMGREQDDLESLIEKRLLENGLSLWESWALMGGFASPEASMRFVKHVIEEGDVSDEVFSEYKNFNEVPPMAFLTQQDKEMR